MPDRPLLIFPTPSNANRERRNGGASKVHYPSKGSQVGRIAPRLEALVRTFEQARARVQPSVTGAAPEQVLVLETIGSVEDFMRAVGRTPGMEWLVSFDIDDLPPDNDFYIDGQDGHSLGGAVYLVMANQQAIAELQQLWGIYRSSSNPAFARGLAPWRHIFDRLRDIRPWGVRDRFESTGIREIWRDVIAQGATQVRAEIELWFRQTLAEQNRYEQTLVNLVQAFGGQVSRRVKIPDIRYHGLLATIPAQSVTTLMADPHTALINCDQVMFFRPTGQASCIMPEEAAAAEGSLPPRTAAVSGPPIVAIFDGLPLQNHDLLANRLQVDDPDGWEGGILAADRQHGTAMASLVAHGELDANEPPLGRPVYCRPILRPKLHPAFPNSREEHIPDDEMPIDLIHRCVRRLFEAEPGQPAAAPTVKIINLSVCDRSRPFVNELSPLARLLDWLAWKYKVLFVVSGGNHPTPITLAISQQTFATLTNEERERAVLTALATELPMRRVLSPSEAINCLTVGALHADRSTNAQLGARLDLFRGALPSPINPLGLGFRRSIKPELLNTGGRQLYATNPISTGNTTQLNLVNAAAHPPGVLVARPGIRAGDTGATRYMCGTSNAAALTTRAAAQIWEMLNTLRSGNGIARFDPAYDALLTKTLLVHSAAWGDAYSVIEAALKNNSNSRSFREYAARFLGYGAVKASRVLTCTDQRATLIGCGELRSEQAHVYEVPLPPSLSGVRGLRRVVVTLGWISPLNPQHSAYRRAHLWFEPENDTLRTARREADYRLVQRGTIQHEIFEGQSAVSYTDGQTLRIKVNCREHAGELAGAVPYAIAFTLETEPSSTIQVYHEIEQRIRPQARVTT